MADRARVHEVVAVGAIAAAVVPLLVLCAYVHPQNDDYHFAVTTRQYGFVIANASWYLNWTGRYLSTALLSANPLLLGSFAAYKWETLAVVLAVPSSALALLSAACPAAPVALRVATALAFAAVFGAGAPDLVEALYWLSGSITYVLGGALLLLLAAVLVLRERTAAPSARRLLAGAGAVLALAAAGTNEVTGCQILAVLGLAFAWSTWRARRVDRVLLGLVLVAGAGLALDVLAPGSRVRLAATSHHPLSWALAAAAREGALRAWEWSTGTAAIPFVLLAAPLLAPARRESGRPLPHPALALAAFAAIHVLSFVPSFYGSGHVEGRTANAVFWFWLAALGAIAWLAAARAPGLQVVRRAPIAAALSAAALALLAAPGSNLAVAVADLASGAAARYDRQQLERYDAIAACPELACAVAPLAARPRSIAFFEDAIAPGDDAFWVDYKQRGFARAFSKSRIALAPAPEPAAALAR